METVIPIFPPHLRVFAAACFAGVDRPEEIRLRAGQPLLLYRGGGEFFWNPKEESLTKINQEKTNQENINQERITQESINQEKINQKNIRLMQERGEVYITKKQDVTDILSAASTYSLYAFEEEIRSGFLTLFGGHRIGLAGRAVCEGGMLKTLRQISFLNIRIAAEHKGCADSVIAYIRKGNSIYNTLILSPPGAGKTTLLRDLIRQLSEGGGEFPGKKLGVVDERSELAACCEGIPQNDLGSRTDVLDACPKSEGMRMLLRSMSPEILAVDELGTKEDYEAVEAALHCGCRILGTMHAERVAELREKPYLMRWIERGFFERYLFLNQKREYQVYDERLMQIH